MKPSSVLGFGPSWPVNQPFSPKKEEEKKEAKEEFANRLTKAFMDAINPERQRLGRRKRKRLRKAIYKIIINEIERPPKDKDGNIAPPAQLRIPGT